MRAEPQIWSKPGRVFHHKPLPIIFWLNPGTTFCLHHLSNISSNLLHLVVNQGCWASTDALPHLTGVCQLSLSHQYSSICLVYSFSFISFICVVNEIDRHIWHILVFHSVVSIHRLHMIACDHNMTSQYSCQNYSDLDAWLPSQGSPSLISQNTNIIIIESNLRKPQNFLGLSYFWIR